MKLSILGSTGSIGTQTLDVVRNNNDIEVVAISANSNIELLEKQAREFNPEMICVYDVDKAEQLKTSVSDLNVKVVSGMDGLIEIATMNSADIVLTAVVGMIGITG